MTELPHTIYVNGFMKYNILQHGIPSKPLGLEHRLITPTDIARVDGIIENGFTPNSLTHDVLLSIIIVNDATYGVGEKEAASRKNQPIFIIMEEKVLEVDDIQLSFGAVHWLVDKVNRLYTEYAGTLKNKIEVSSIKLVPSVMFGESFELVLPSMAGRIDQDSLPNLVFKKSIRSMTIPFNTLDALRLMTNNLVSRSAARSMPSFAYIKNSTVNDFTSVKYNHLIENSVFQLESNLDYTSPVQTAEHVIELDIIRSLIASKSTSFLRTVFDEAFNADSLAVTQEDRINHTINLISVIQMCEVVAFASEYHKMSLVYLPTQTIVSDTKINSLLLSAYYEAFAHIALINNKNTNKTINLIIRYPKTASKHDFTEIMLPMFAVIKNRPVKVIFYDTDEEIFKLSPFTCFEVSE